MLQFKNGKFCALGLSFAIPDGFYIDTEPETIADNTIVAWAPDMRYQAEWQIYDAEQGTMEDFEEFFKNSGFTALSKLTPIAINGLTGHQLYYRSNEEVYYEVHLSNGESSIMLYICVHQRDGDIYQITASSEFRAIISKLGGLEHTAPEA